MAKAVTIAMNVDFDGQGSHDSYVSFNGQGSHNSHVGFDSQGGHNNHVGFDSQGVTIAMTSFLLQN